MFARVRRFWREFLSRSGTINNEPLNKVSLIVIIFIDIFILVNVFTGLDDISRWHLSPSQAYPCYSEWKGYQAKTNKDKDYEIVKSSLQFDTAPSLQQDYLQQQRGHLGKVSEVCQKYAEYKDKIYNSENRQTIKTIDQKQSQIAKLEQTNRNIRTQYDSTLLEKIAGQKNQQSINAVSAEKAKQELDKNSRNIATLNQDISNLKNQLVTKPESSNFLNFVKDNGQFKPVEAGYKRADFWYPSIQFAFQSLFLVPLILVALSVYNFAQRRGYGLISLISWHLLVIFFIPLVLKVFEFLRFGVILEFLINVFNALFGGLLFLISYVYILLIPLLGFGVIKFLQKVIFNSKVQAANRVQKSRCINCARKIGSNDAYCPHCGYYQYIECPNCHNLTYKYLPHCKVCGHPQDLSNL